MTKAKNSAASKFRPWSHSAHETLVPPVKVKKVRKGRSSKANSATAKLTLLAEESAKKADAIFAIITDPVSLESEPYTVVLDVLTIEYLRQRILNNALDIAEAVIRDKQSQSAKKKRRNRQHPQRKVVFDYLQQWKNRPELYATKAAFVNDMLEKTGMTRPQTIQDWVKEFDNS